LHDLQDTKKIKVREKVNVHHMKRVRGTSTMVWTEGRSRRGPLLDVSCCIQIVIIESLFKKKFVLIRVQGGVVLLELREMYKALFQIEIALSEREMLIAFERCYTLCLAYASEIPQNMTLETNYEVSHQEVFLRSRCLLYLD